jgi:hypothetical protein
MEDILLQETALVTQIVMARLRIAKPRTLDYKRKNVNKQDLRSHIYLFLIKLPYLAFFLSALVPAAPSSYSRELITS